MHIESMSFSCDAGLGADEDCSFYGKPLRVDEKSDDVSIDLDMEDQLETDRKFLEYAADDMDLPNNEQV